MAPEWQLVESPSGDMYYSAYVPFPYDMVLRFPAWEGPPAFSPEEMAFRIHLDHVWFEFFKDYLFATGICVAHIGGALGMEVLIAAYTEGASRVLHYTMAGIGALKAIIGWEECKAEFAKIMERRNIWHRFSYRSISPGLERGWIPNNSQGRGHIF